MNKLVPSTTSILSNYKGVRGLVQSTSPSGYIPLPKSVQSNPLVSGLGTESSSIEKPNPEVQVAEKAASLTQVGRGRRRRRAVSRNPKRRRQQRGTKKRRKVARKQKKRVAKPRRKSRIIRKRRGRKVLRKKRKSVLIRKKITRRRGRRTVKKQKRRTSKRSGRGAQFPGIVIENPVI